MADWERAGKKREFKRAVKKTGVKGWKTKTKAVLRYLKCIKSLHAYLEKQILEY